jgi:hypothetical protein
VNFSKFGDYPVRLLIFYRKHELVTDEGGNITSSGICALVHSCEYLLEQDVREWLDRLEETHLCKRWKLESQRSPIGAHANVPLLWSVPIELLQEHVYIINNDHGLSKSWQGSKYVWEWYDQHTVWPTKFLLEKESLN